MVEQIFPRSSEKWANFEIGEIFKISNFCHGENAYFALVWAARNSTINLMAAASVKSGPP